MLLFSCSEDKGNYSYAELNDVDIQMAKSLQVVLHENMDIVPVLSAKDFQEDAYTFDWTAYPTDNSTPTTLANTRELHTLVSLPTGTYTLVYTIREKDGGFFYRATADLIVNTPFSAGWLVLCDDGGHTRLDMYSDIKQQLYTDILPAEVNSLSGPLQLQFIAQRSVAESPFYLITEGGTTRLGDNDFAWKEEYRIAYEMGDEADRAVVPAIMAVNGAGKVIVDKAGGVYYCNNTMGDGLYNKKRANKFAVAPFIGCDKLSYHYVPTFMMYNKTSKNFVVCAEMFSNYDLLGMNTPADVSLKLLYTMYGFPYSNYELFSIPDKTYDLLWMENTTYDPLHMEIGTTYAVMSSASAVMLYGFALGDMLGVRYDKYGYTVTNVITRNLTSCSNIRQAKHFAFSSLKNIMYYAVGNKVYSVNLSNETPVAQLEIELPSDEQIGMMKFYHYTQSANSARSYDLIIATDKSGEGILRVYDGWAKEGSFVGVEPKVMLNGFAKIKDVIYREIVTEYEL